MSVRFTPARLALSLAAVLLTPGLSVAQAQSAAPAAALRATLPGIEVTGALPIVTEDIDSYTIGASGHPGRDQFAQGVDALCRRGV